MPCCHNSLTMTGLSCVQLQSLCAEQSTCPACLLQPPNLQPPYQRQHLGEGAVMEQQDWSLHYDPTWAALRRAHATVVSSLIAPFYVLYFVNTIRRRDHLSIMQVSVWPGWPAGTGLTWKMSPVKWPLARRPARLRPRRAPQPPLLLLAAQ